MANTYLTRTFGTPDGPGGGTFIWTMSAWIKKTGTGSDVGIMTRYVNANKFVKIFFNSDDQLEYAVYNGNYQARYQTTARYRDVNSWYHIVVAQNSTLATAADRVKIYVNGELITSFAVNTQIGQNIGGDFNTASAPHQIGAYNSTQFFNGLMSAFNFIDNTQYAASDFGSTDATTGQWKINTSPSVTYGATGFSILNNGNTITDQSTNSNNWSSNGAGVTDTKDCPSNVFSTMNSLATSSFATLTNGNNTLTGNSASNNGHSFSTLSLPDASGKYYFEVKFTTIVGGEYPPVALCLTSDVEYGVILNGGAGDPRDRVIGMDPRGYTYNGSSNTSGVFSALSNGDIASFAFDMDNGAYYMSINGAAYLTSGNPTSGASRTGALVTWTPNSSNDYGIWISPYNNSVCSINFGNGYFGTTAVSSAGTAGSTPGTFEYDVPSGYQPLTTKGLNA